MGTSRFGAGPWPAWACVPEDVRHVHQRAFVEAITLGDDADGDDRSVRRKFSEWLRQLGEGEFAPLSESRREHLVVVAQRSLEVYLRWRATQDLLLMLNNVIRVEWHSDFVSRSCNAR